ncbi:metallo-mystery pair system four-Cys motif protein [Alcaligenes faecalis]|uniref:MbnP family copper-binding protein n=1 Tax=Alcaligenes faecalis TaxID=511 RepID=UPI001933052C|nr:MbnP family copper-binding protein [Alcaligenes faecalis]QRF90592.1 metallo-mystery pair system four-Cys motif protein [Alcaligenes faecalis]
MQIYFVLSSLAAALALATSGQAAHAASTRQAITIDVALVAGAAPVRCDQALPALGSDARPSQLHDARFYVQDIALLDAQGRHTPLQLTPNDWQNGHVALLDFEDATGQCTGGTRPTNTSITGTLPTGQYRGLSFTVGVPGALNHTSTELEGSPLDLASMGWSWQAGRKFMKVEVNPEGGVLKADGSRSATWYVHLGSTGCTGNPVTGATVSCLRANRLPITLSDFDPDHHQVVMDLASLLQQSRLSEDQGGAAGCMSSPADPECISIFERLGLSLETGEPIPSNESAVFSIRPKPTAPTAH